MTALSMPQVNVADSMASQIRCITWPLIVGKLHLSQASPACHQAFPVQRIYLQSLSAWPLLKPATMRAGVNILSVRVTKPSIPASIITNYKAMEEERTKELIAQARERVVTREAEIERTRAIMQVLLSLPH